MVAMQKECYDYYPFGMPMPNKNSINNNYRYAYQGQEKDPENGKEAFELRLWDSRIGRWLTTDPYRQYASPYLGMGNNPVNTIDPDGGCTDCPENATEGQEFNSVNGHVTFHDGGWVDDNGYTVLDDVVIRAHNKNAVGASSAIQASNARYMAIFNERHIKTQKEVVPYVGAMVALPFAVAGAFWIAGEALIADGIFLNSSASSISGGYGVSAETVGVVENVGYFSNITRAGSAGRGIYNATGIGKHAINGQIFSQGTKYVLQRGVVDGTRYITNESAKLLFRYHGVTKLAKVIGIGGAIGLPAYSTYKLIKQRQNDVKP